MKAEDRSFFVVPPSSFILSPVVDILECLTLSVRRQGYMAKYIVRYGVMRLLGVFSTSGGGEFCRGTAVIARTDRGLEAAEVLCEASRRPSRP